MSSDRDIGIGISRVLVDRCGLARERLTQFDPDDFTSALDVLEQVGSGTTGTLLVYWLARPSNEEAARSSLEQVISSSPASAVIILLDRWSWNLPYILDRPSFVVSTTGDDIRLGSALITILDQEGPELTSEDLSGQLGRATRTTHLFSPGGRDLGFAGANNRTEVELTIEAGSPVHSLEAFTSPAGATMIAAGCGDGRILVWEARGGGRVRIVESHSGPVTALCAVDDTHLVSGGQDKRVSIWRTDSGWSSRELTGYRAGINDLTVFGWDSTARIASATEVGELWLSTLKSNQHQAVGGAGKVVAVAGTATDLVAASDRGRVVLSNGTTQRVIGEHGGQVRALAASGRRVVAGGLHHSISLWDLDSGLKVRQWTGHGAGVVALDWIRFPGGAELVVSATSANTIRLWDPETGEQRRMCLLADPPNALTHFTAADGGPRVVSAGMSGVIRIWNPGLTATARTGSVLTRGFGDRTSTVDLLNRGAFIETTAELLRPQSTTDPDVGPNVLTIEGPWGSGKSTMLELVKAELTTGRHSEPGKRLAVWQADRLLRRPPEVVELPPAPPTGSVVASFNPWRHQSSEQVWAGLAKTVTEAVEDAVLPDRDSRERHWFARNATRIDQRHAQRELWKRVRSPFLTVGVLALGVTVVTQLARLPIPIPWLIAVPSSPLVIGLLHTAKRYFWDRASAFLPRELFAGPVLSNAFSSGGNDSVRDPYYNARSGYLYLVQHDVTELLKDLEQHGLQLVVFIDDLDRCTPKTTAEVFEAINVFLSDALPRTRFVLGLDPVVV
ncbi:MAG TPA: P-loop NTPase fold protein, partial [Umezawaea sp.]|nr:P-loop NTPase fold protein [Umezawaea sp.]